LRERILKMLGRKIGEMAGVTVVTHILRTETIA